MHCGEDPCEGGVKGDSSEETRLYEADGVHHTGLGTSQRLIGIFNLMDVAYSATREPRENRLA